ncbi:MAG: hypothetical protein ACT443_08295, partial [Gemmatimonadota bacterium]
LEGPTLDLNLVVRIGSAAARQGRREVDSYLLIAYGSNVCVTCLNAGLRSLRQWRVKASPVHAVIGEESRGDRERAALLREDSLLPYPITFVPAADLQRTLFSHLGEEHAEEPIYLLIDRQFKIRSVFQADQKRPDLLDEWLEAISR